MSRHWVIAPVESKPGEVFDKVWQFDLANGLISIGWQNLGDVSRMSRDELIQAVASAYPDKPQQTKGLIANMLWSFYHEIRPGDFLIARRGRKVLAAVGEVIEAAVHTPGRNPAHGHRGFLKVSWRDQPRDKAFPTVVFPMHTLAELSREEFDNFLGGSGLPAEALVAAEPLEDPNAFVLEKYLEDFVVSNFDTIFKGQLKIYEDAEGNEGQQYATDIGPIDILAVDQSSRSFVVMVCGCGVRSCNHTCSFRRSHNLFPQSEFKGPPLLPLLWLKDTLEKRNRGYAYSLLTESERGQERCYAQSVLGFNHWRSRKGDILLYVLTEPMRAASLLRIGHF